MVNKNNFLFRALSKENAATFKVVDRVRALKHPVGVPCDRKGDIGKIEKIEKIDGELALVRFDNVDVIWFQLKYLEYRSATTSSKRLLIRQVTNYASNRAKGNTKQKNISAMTRQRFSQISKIYRDLFIKLKNLDSACR